MELRQLRYFAAVARHRHVTRAAEALHVTQPALSQQVRRLEAELGVVLLHRTPHGVEPTPAGLDLLDHAERLLADADALRRRMDGHAGAVRGVARVAAPAGEAPGLAAALAAFAREHPGLGLALRQAPGAEAAELLRRGAVDLVVRAEPAGAPVPAGVAATTLREEPLALLLPAGDALAAAEAVALWDVRDRAFVLGEDGSALRAATMAACAAAGFGPVPRFAVGDPAAVGHLVAAGLGVALVPRSWAAGMDGVRAVPPADPVPPLRSRLLAPAAGASPAAELLRAWLADELARDPS